MMPLGVDAFNARRVARFDFGATSGGVMSALSYFSGSRPAMNKWGRRRF